MWVLESQSTNTPLTLDPWVASPYEAQNWKNQTSSQDHYNLVFQHALFILIPNIIFTWTVVSHNWVYTIGHKNYAVLWIRLFFLLLL